jgi:hypothetical protein
MHANRSDRTLEGLGAAGFFLFAAGQIFQAYVLTGAPAPADLEANIRFDLSAASQARAVLLFVGFLLFPAAYAAAALRTGRRGWAAVGLLWLALFVGFELLNRGYELANVLAWERAWLSANDAALRSQLAARVTAYGELQATATLLILPCYALGSGALAIALDARDRLSRLARLGLALNAVRATLRFGALVLGIGFLGPVSDAIFFPVMIFQYAALGVWLSLRPRDAPLAA